MRTFFPMLWMSVAVGLAPGAVHARAAADAPPWSAAAQPGWYAVRGGAWNVDADTVAAMRMMVGGQASIPLDNYIVQYQGVLDHEHRAVKVAGACHVDRMSSAMLAANFHVVYDGGKCYFDATYDPAERRFTWFAFHGNA